MIILCVFFSPLLICRNPLEHRVVSMTQVVVTEEKVKTHRSQWLISPDLILSDPFQVDLHTQAG